MPANKNENAFTEVMSQHSDKQLAEIITIYRNDYQPRAIEAAEIEVKRRKLDLASLITESDIKKAEEAHKPIELSKENLHWYFKILTLGLPGAVYFICQRIFIDAPPFVYLFIPISIGLQYFIYHLLSGKKLTKPALDFKTWCYYAWFLRVVFFIVGYMP